MQLRDYQQESVDKTFDAVCRRENPLIVLPTGAGKSVVQAGFIRRILIDWPTERFVLVTHSQELIQQNASKIQAMLPGVGVGIFSAGLGKKETGYQVTVAGIQSAWKHAHRMGDVSFVIVDEAHLVSKNENSMSH